jgi:glycosyltransferase involved in cell wall biosynthesis
MTTLSLSMIVKNEEETLARTLTAARQFCDEMIVVDRGSTDTTVQICRDLGATVHFFEWIDDFAAARNYSLQECTGDWVIWLDADDVITEENIEKILTLKSTLLSDQWDAVYCTYNYDHDERGVSRLSLSRDRFFRRTPYLKWKDPIHEYVENDTFKAVHYAPEITVSHFPLQKKRPSKSLLYFNILKKALQNEKNQESFPRYYFFMACEYSFQGLLEDAIEAYEKNLLFNEDAYAPYMTHIEMLKCFKALNAYEKALSIGLAAIKLSGNRAEAFSELGILHCEHQQYDKAIPMLMAASQCPFPEERKENVRDADYTWRPWETLSYCYFNMRQYSKAFQAAMQAMEQKHPMPAHFQEHMQTCLKLVQKSFVSHANQAQ